MISTDSYDDSCGHVRIPDLLLVELREHALEDAIDKLVYHEDVDQDDLTKRFGVWFADNKERIWEDVAVPAIYQIMRMAQEDDIYPEDDNWQHPDDPEMLRGGSSSLA